ncbi:PDPFL protein, partial [Campylorhamphus procurvoides]|nr:PDPFL protein [Campylorhamphus procurvoides]
MASVPSAGCLLAKNQYYRSECSGGRELREVPKHTQYLIVWSFPPLAGLPDLIDKYWWIKSFFHSEPSPPTVGRKTLSAS